MSKTPRVKITSRGKVAPWDLPPLAPDAFRALPAKEQLEYLAAVAHLAPSSHNTQPWRFRLDASHLQIAVYVDRTSILPESDPSGRQAFMSIGCATEHLIIAANALGMKADITVLPLTSEQVLGHAQQGLMHVVDVSFKEGGAVAQQDLFEAIWKRKSVRAEFDPALAIPRDVLIALKGIAGGKSVLARIVTDPILRQKLAELQGQGDGFVINDPLFMKELGAWLLPNNTRSLVGMPGFVFGLKDAEALRLHRGLSGIAPLQPEDGLKFAIMGKRSIETSPAVCLLSVAHDDPKHWILVGRTFERMFLTVVSRGFQVAVHEAIVEVPLIQRMFRAAFPGKGRLVLVFRIGLVKNKKDLERTRAPRMLLEQIVV